MYSLRWTKNDEKNLFFVVNLLSHTPLQVASNLLDGFKSSFEDLFKSSLVGTTLKQRLNCNSFTAEFAKLEETFVRENATHRRKNLLSKIGKRIKNDKIPDGGTISMEDAHSNAKDDSSSPSKEKQRASKVSILKESKFIERNKEMPNSEIRKKSKAKRVWKDKKLSNKEKIALDFSIEKNSENPNCTSLIAGPSDFSSLDSSKRGEEKCLAETSSDEEIITKNEGISARIHFLFNKLSSRTLSEENISSNLAEIEALLIDRNVAMEISKELCEVVRSDLIGKTVTVFGSTGYLVYKAFHDALVRIITPTRPINLLKGISKCRESGNPFSILFVGVNGVGKSTSLAKIAHYLKKRNLKVSVAACDTFRSGAVEQLLTHAKALSLRVFHRGYANDASHVCEEALKEAHTKEDDVVLIDTAGRMQNNEPLMRSLEKLYQKNHPDLVLFVGEALVGNEALDQLEKFSRHAPVDGIILTKFDAVGEKAGAAISLTYHSRLPIVFLGTGQTYEALRKVGPEKLAETLLH